jgi:excisionase family DNA binding protein
MNTQMTVGDAAARFGVSTSTFKRLCERHEVELHRTPGGHRRISVASLESLSKRIGLGGLSRNGQKEASEILQSDRVVELLRSREAGELRTQVLAACDEPSDIATIIDQSLAPAMWRVGTMWQRGEFQSFEANLCTDTMLRCIYLLEPHFQTSTPQSMKAVGGSLHQGCDTVASKMVALCLNSIGIDAIDLGPRVPADEMAAASHTLDTCLVWCNSTHWDNQSDAISQHLLLRRLMPVESPLLIGGGGLSVSAQQALEGCRYLETLAEMVAFVKTVLLNDEPQRNTLLSTTIKG